MYAKTISDYFNIRNKYVYKGIPIVDKVSILNHIKTNIVYQQVPIKYGARTYQFSSTI